jgi:voltage-gated sodium channel
MNVSFLTLQHNLKSLHNNKVFELFVIAVIVFSALVIGAKTYDIPPLALSIISWLDIGITLFFMLEIIIRFTAHPNKVYFFRDAWNVFDTLIVIVSFIPIENSEMAFIGRLVRVFRVLRMVSIIPELRMLLNSLVKALPQLGYVLLLMFIIFYIYGAIGSILFSSIDNELWGDISISMLTLFRIMTFEDWTDVMYATMDVYPMSWTYHLSFIFLTAFAFLNMVIGIVVSVIEEENRAQEQLRDPQPSMKDLQREIQELKALMISHQ